MIDFKFVGDVAFPLLFLRNFRIGNRFEIAEINFGKENIARIILIDLRQVDPVTEVRLHGFLVHRRSADDPDDVVDVWISGQSFDRVLKYIIDKNLIIKLLVIFKLPHLFAKTRAIRCLNKSIPMFCPQISIN